VIARSNAYAYTPAARAARRSRGVALLGDLKKKQHAFLWDGTEVQVLTQLGGSTLVLYIESHARIPLSPLSEVTLTRPAPVR